MSSSSLADASKGLPPPGQLLLGKYRLERYLAHGGMGVVASARHVELDEPVALKFLRPDLLEDPGANELASRFLREARATIKIRSQHVPRIYDVATTPEGVPFMVMELLSGEDLDKVLERGDGLPVEEAVEVMLQAIEGLASAHATGMIHRDFKPANVFLGRALDGSLSVKVLDFGIAKLVDSGLLPSADGSMTATNHVMGSPRYMAPEQMRSARDIDARADVWAVGVTLYEMLTCEAPFEGDTIPQICASILQDAPKPLRARRPDVPEGLAAAVEACLGKTPETRLPDVAAVAEAIAPFGPRPWSMESAARTRRLVAVAATVVARASQPDRGSSLPPPRRSSPDATALPIVPIVPIVKTPPAPMAPARAGLETSGSWTHGGQAGLPSNRTGITVLVALAIAAALGVAALFLVRKNQSADPDATGVVATPAKATVPPPSAPALEPAPPPSTITITAPETPPPPEKRPVASAAPRAPVRAPTTKPATTATAPATTTPPPPAPSSKPAQGGLWDERK